MIKKKIIIKKKKKKEEEKAIAPKYKYHMEHQKKGNKKNERKAKTMREVEVYSRHELNKGGIFS